MAQQTINIGTVANDGTGDDLRTGGDKINDNFTELYAADTALDGRVTTLEGSPGGVATLDDVGDVNAPTPGDGNALVWDNTAGEWVDAPLPGGGAGGTVPDGGTTGQVLTKQSGVDQDTGWGYPALPPSALFEDQKAANTAGGSSTSGSWLARTLNTEVFNEISGASLASNQITLPAGTYEVEAVSIVQKSGRSRIRLRDVTNSVTLALSDNGFGDTTIATAYNGRVLGRFTLSGTATVELQYRVGQSQATNGLGLESNYGEVEIYSRLLLRKIG